MEQTKKLNVDVPQDVRPEDLKVIMPWDRRAAELEATEGCYCHYAAWKEWFEAWNEKQSPAMELDIGELDTVALYAAFCAACSECQLG